MNFTGERGDKTSFGSVRVSIPDNHRVGQTERPVNWTFFGFTLISKPEDDRKHFIIKDTKVLSEIEFSQLAQSSSPSEALIFVHGFNNSFEDSAFRTAQIVWDLQYKGLPVLFSWASKGSIGDYLYDRDSAYLARSDFLNLIKILREKAGINKIHVLAHSMGNILVLDALANYSNTAEPASIAQLIMAAPDVDRDQFMKLIPDVARITKGMTLYASANDKALSLSKALSKAPRAGDLILGTPIVMPGLESVDVSSLGDEMLGLNHNVFSTSKSIMNDVKYLLNGMPPPRLIEVRGFPKNIVPPRFWRYSQ